MSQFKFVNLVSKELDFVGDDSYLTSKVGNQSIIRNRVRPLSGTLPQAGSTISYRIVSNSGSFMNSAPKVEAKIVSYIVGYNGAGTAKVIPAYNDLVNRFGLHSLPLNRMIAKTDVQFQNTSMTTNNADQVEYYLNAMDVETLAEISPASKPDLFSAYLADRLADPLRVGADTINADETRGIGGNFQFSFDATADANTYKLTIILEECLMAKPFQFQNPLEAVAFPNFNADIELTLASNFSKALIALNVDGAQNFRMFSTYAAAVAAPAAMPAWETDVVALESLNLIAEQFVPQPSALPKVPSKFYYNSHYLQRLPVSSHPAIASGGAVGTDGAATTLQINSSQVQGIPSRFCLAVFERRPDFRTPQRTAKFVPGQMKLNVSGKNDVLGTYDLTENPGALYRLAIKNGYNQRQASFLCSLAEADTVGSSAVLYFSPCDINMTNFAQENANMMLEIDATFQVVNNIASAQLAAGSYDAQMYLLHENVIEYDLASNEWTERRAWISPDKIAAAPARFVDDSEVARHSVRGGRLNLSKIWKSIKGFVSRPEVKAAVKHIRNAPMLKDVAGDGTTIGKLASAVGAGKGGGVTKIGGAALSNDQLLSMIQ